MINNHSLWNRSIVFFIYHTMSLVHFSVNSTASIISISCLLLSWMNTYIVKYFKIFFVYKHKFSILNIYLIMISLINRPVFNNIKFNIFLFGKLKSFLFSWEVLLNIYIFIFMSDRSDEIFGSIFWSSFLYTAVIFYEILRIYFCLFYHFKKICLIHSNNTTLAGYITH